LWLCVHRCGELLLRHRLAVGVLLVHTTLSDGTANTTESAL
jgi:hypothetical protein